MWLIIGQWWYYKFPHIQKQSLPMKTCVSWNKVKQRNNYHLLMLKKNLVFLDTKSNLPNCNKLLQNLMASLNDIYLTVFWGSEFGTDSLGSSGLKSLARSPKLETPPPRRLPHTAGVWYCLWGASLTVFSPVPAPGLPRCLHNWYGWFSPEQVNQERAMEATVPFMT